MLEPIPLLALDLPRTRPAWRWFADANAPDFLDIALEELDEYEREEVLREFSIRRQRDAMTRTMDKGGAEKGIALAVTQGAMTLSEGRSMASWYATARDCEDPNGALVASFALMLRERLAKWLPHLYEQTRDFVVLVSPVFRFNGESLRLDSGRPLVFISEEAAAMSANIGIIVGHALEASSLKDEELFDRSMRALAFHAAATAIHIPEIYNLADQFQETLFGDRMKFHSDSVHGMVGELAGVAVLCHELAHVLLGHIDLRSDTETMRRDEIEADLFSLRTLLSASPRSDITGMFASAALAPALLMTTVAGLKPEPLVNSAVHPSWSERWDALIQQIDGSIAPVGKMLSELSRHALIFAKDTNLVEKLIKQWEKGDMIDFGKVIAKANLDGHPDSS